MKFSTLSEIQQADGLRIVIVQGLPSPWSQAAKTIFEIKGLDHRIGAYVPFGTNEDVARWGGENSAPIVAWNDEKPIHRWVDILNLAERLAPTPSLVPADPRERALMFGFSNEICGERGIGWNRRLQIVAPAMQSDAPPADVVRLSGKYGYNAEDAGAAGKRVAASLRALDQQLASQQARGVDYFVGDALSALDIYWVAFMNVIQPLPKESCPIPDDWRPGFVASDPEVTGALSDRLVRHRDTIFQQHYRDPMEF